MNLLSITNKVIAKSLNLLESDVERAWKYWQDQGIVLVDSNDAENIRIKYFNIVSLMLEGKNVKLPENQPTKTSSAIKDMYKTIEYMFSRPLSSREIKMVDSWLVEFKFSPEMVTLLIEYCMEKKKKDFNYLNRVAASWYDQGITTYEGAMDHIEKSNLRWSNYYTIMKFLGFSRQPSKPETEFMDKWFETFGMSMDMVMEGCRRMSSIDKPNFKYLDTILSSWHKNNFKTVGEIKDEPGKNSPGRSKKSKQDENPGYDYDLLEKKLKDKIWSDNK